jgi:hypothetical protein
MKTFKPLACSTRVISDYTLKSCRGCNAKRLSAAINLNRIKKKDKDSLSQLLESSR